MNHRLARWASLGLLAAGSSSFAADIAWTTGPSFGSANGHLGILTNGTLVDAVHLLGSNAGSVTVDPAGLNLVFRNVDSPFFNTVFTDPGNGIGDAGWAAVVRSFEWNSGSDVNALSFLSGLTVGATYQIQFFSGRSHPCCGDRTLIIGNGEGSVSAPISQAPLAFQSVVGTFIADATTQRFVFDDNSNNPSLSAYVLRDVTAVPEPGTWALMALGLAAVGVAGRRRA